MFTLKFFELGVYDFYSFYVISYLVAVKQIQEALSFFDLRSKSLKSGCRLPSTKHVVYKTNPFLQTMKFYERSNILFAVVYDKPDRILLGSVVKTR